MSRAAVDRNRKSFTPEFARGAKDAKRSVRLSRKVGLVPSQCLSAVNTGLT